MTLVRKLFIFEIKRTSSSRVVVRREYVLPETVLQFHVASMDGLLIV